MPVRPFRARAAAPLCLGSLLGLQALVGCAEEARPPRAGFGHGGDSGSSGIPVPPSLPAGCGNEEIPALVEVPRLYFVLDRSGSMGEALPGEGRSKWQATHAAVAGLLRAIGHRVEYGAAIFPGAGGTCDAGREVFPISAGDPPPAMPSSRNGPTLQYLIDRLSVLEPDGGTPVANTLSALQPLLAESTAKTYVVLATDGAPNCNAEAECTTASCIPDIEGASFDGRLCGVEFSCCDARVLGRGAESNCVDELSTLAAVEELSAAGIPTYVIGMPGASAFEGVLDALAVAGGTARDGSPAYFAIADASDLSAALFEIGTGVAISCELELARVPADASLVNVYYDGELVPYGERDGWVWDGETALVFNGAACSELRSGSVARVSINYGCATVIE
jgi:hypothetical protein